MRKTEEKKKERKELEGSEVVVVDSLMMEEMEIDREEVTPEREERQEETAKEFFYELLNEKEVGKSKKPVETEESTSSATMSFASVVQSGPAVTSKVKSQNIATGYSLAQGRMGIEISAFG